MTDYRVKLDVYNGPLDLMLYLIKRDEIDIHDIPIAKILEQYLGYVTLVKQIDPDVAGEFLVMASTLMEIKTRMLLPRQEGAGQDDGAFDPRSELVRQLLEYKAFKDAADGLRSSASLQSLRFPRRPPELQAQEQGKDLDDVVIWDLLDAFNAIMAEIGKGKRETEIIYDDTPIELHVEDILDRLRRETGLTFRAIFAGRTTHSECIGLFLAVLELCRRNAILVEQERSFGEVYIMLRGPDGKAVVPAQSAEAPAAPPPVAGIPQASGQYISDRADAPPQEEDQDDDSGRETQGSGT